MKLFCLLVLFTLSPSIFSILVLQNRATAQIIPDGKLGGTENSVVNPDVIDGIGSDRIDGGAIRGSNLFHSFQDFNIDAGRGAYFSNPAGIANILTRVTGGNPSNIRGKLGVLGNANLFLLNPKGIFFGPNASLDLRGGSFFGSTADSLVFDNFEFSASNPQAVPQLIINIPIGLRFRDNPGSISNNAPLQVQTGNTLSLLGGNVNLDGGSLIAPEGKVELGGLTQAVTIGLDPDGNLSFPNGITRADVLLRNTSRVNVADQGKGSVSIIARNLNIETGSIVSAGIKPNLTASTSVPGNVTLDVTEAIKINGQSLVENVADRNAIGDAGDVIVKANYLELTGGGRIRTRTIGRQSNAGDINITAGDIFISNPVYWPIDKAPPEDKPALDASSNISDISGSGRSGKISLTADGNITLIGEGSPGTVDRENKVISTYSVGRGALGDGNISLKAKGSISLSNANLVTTVSTDNSNAAAGKISLQGDTSVSLTNNSQLAATGYGRGNPSTVILRSNGPVKVQSSAIFADIRNAAKFEDAGKISIGGESVFITDGSTVTATTGGSGPSSGNFGGLIEVNATDTVEISGITPLFANQVLMRLSRPQSAYSTLVTNTIGNGPAGNIIINTDTLRVSNGGNLKATTQTAFPGGDITVNARVIEFTGGGKILNTASNRGNAGTINLNASDRITISGSNPKFEETFNQYIKNEIAFGQKEINARQNAESRLGTLDTAASGIYAYTLQNSPAQGGSLKIRTGRLLVNNGAKINVGSQGAGRAGNIEVTAAKDIRLDNNASITADTRGGQGNITLNSGDLILRRNSNITTNAKGTVGGGNIIINTGNLVALENSDITANAEQGSGGNIFIKANYLFRSKDSDITASSDRGLESNGTVEINTTDVNPSQGLAELPENIIDLTNQIAQNPCQKGSGSSFTVTGRGGLPSSPNDSFSSNETRVDLVEPVASSSSNSPNLTINQSPVIRQTTKNIVPAQGWVFNKKGEVVLTAYDPTNSSQGRTFQPTAACSVTSYQ
ncbi:MAG: filamentous hemagglutinin N-terminal domain-containing protein [Pelatocladus maniniholoensis HA4357-MV3]|jgi:filamentous hemagglutinin family protein|uniref:Filamentous hemagglutinin N-terminal domain-containing protein n=1 Tax=Pelatocladus maniniholoensis HA4357-MV3 TaxID=1117104 RepID=A0A9E3H6E7_9NOST|nr:filamentous hemagglutinin N-terminal domain-containing protein [Pelatocladus maniniholoensis HA4357-MV3]